MSEAPTVGKFSYRQLAACARREANRRFRIFPQEVGQGLMTMAAADAEIAMMTEIANFLDDIADDTEEDDDDDGFGGDG